MGFILVRKIVFVFLIVSAALVSSSFASMGFRLYCVLDSIVFSGVTYVYMHLNSLSVNEYTSALISGTISCHIFAIYMTEINYNFKLAFV